MSIEIWLAFVAGYTLVSLIPGPSVFMVLSQSLSHGLRASIFCIAGDVIGGLVIMLVAIIGIGTVLLASAESYAIIR